MQFFTDAALNDRRGGLGGFFNGRWFFHMVDSNFIAHFSPGIVFMELAALVIGVLLWGDLDEMKNGKITIFCDNQSVRHMVNNLSSGNARCMRLLRVLALSNIKCNRTLNVEYIKSDDNTLADAISRQNWATFWDNAPEGMFRTPDRVPSAILPLDKFM